MKVPLRWLQEFIDLPTTSIDDLVSAFDTVGLTVEGVEELDIGWTGVYVGRVEAIEDHPDADKIRVCQVDSGEGVQQIICGAWNFETGAFVPVARPGAVLPGDFEIGRRTIRGVESNGMICSEKELDLGEDHAGIIVLDGEPELGLSFDQLVELPDVVFDLDITPNRPDAMSMLGVARDLAAYFDTSFAVPEIEVPTVEGNTPVGVEIEDRVGCRRFTAREIVNVTVGKSPLRVRHRLKKVGVRAISNVVDVTNYVMFELGHPLHAFDGDSIVGDHLVVKRASDGETLVTLDDVERNLTPDDLIIYDDAGPTSMSGTMGGARSEVSDETTRVLMEAASWDPPTIMYMARRHNLISEASARFERGVDPNLADVANERASSMVAAFTGGEILEGSVDVIATSIEPAVIRLSTSDVERLLGPGFDETYVSGILQRLGMSVSGSDPLIVTVPTYRPDLTRPADLVEEVARIHGYDSFEATLPTGPTGGLTHEQRRSRRLTNSLAALGLHQAIHLPFVNPEDLARMGRNPEAEALLTVKNPLREEESKLRPTMLPGLLNSLRYNLSHGAASVALFEVGKVFTSEPDPEEPRLPRQFERLGWAVVGEMGIRSLDDGALAADGAVSLAIWRHLARDLAVIDLEIRPGTRPGFHPARTAEIVSNGEVIGCVGELSPRTARAFEIDGRVAIAEVDLEPILSPVPPTVATSPSVFPPVDFDLSFVVPNNVSSASLLEATRDAGEDLVESAHVFDQFKGPGLEEDARALAITYRLRASDRTLTNEEVAPIRRAMIDAAEELGAKLRGA
jgi:phenylalanyl-tRNA synthetase beta chain